MTTIVDIVRLEAILENLHTWATRVLRPWISHYIDQWKSHHPADSVPVSPHMNEEAESFISEEVTTKTEVEGGGDANDLLRSEQCTRLLQIRTFDDSRPRADSDPFPRPNTAFIANQTNSVLVSSDIQSDNTTNHYSAWPTQVQGSSELWKETTQVLPDIQVELDLGLDPGPSLDIGIPDGSMAGKEEAHDVHLQRKTIRLSTTGRRIHVKLPSLPVDQYLPSNHSSEWETTDGSPNDSPRPAPADVVPATSAIDSSTSPEAHISDDEPDALTEYGNEPLDEPLDGSQTNVPNATSNYFSVLAEDDVASVDASTDIEATPLDTEVVITEAETAPDDEAKELPKPFFFTGQESPPSEQPGEQLGSPREFKFELGSLPLKELPASPEKDGPDNCRSRTRSPAPLAMLRATGLMPAARRSLPARGSTNMHRQRPPNPVHLVGHAVARMRIIAVSDLGLKDEEDQVSRQLISWPHGVAKDDTGLSHYTFQCKQGTLSFFLSACGLTLYPEKSACTYRHSSCPRGRAMEGDTVPGLGVPVMVAWFTSLFIQKLLGKPPVDDIDQSLQEFLSRLSRQQQVVGQPEVT